MADFGFGGALLIALQPTNLLACFMGAVVGTLVGVLPGIGPAAAMALIIPLTFKLGPTAGLIMLAGIYYGAMYGGSTTSILVNVPGEPGERGNRIRGVPDGSQGSGRGCPGGGRRLVRSSPGPSVSFLCSSLPPFLPERPWLSGRRSILPYPSSG